MIAIKIRLIVQPLVEVQNCLLTEMVRITKKTETRMTWFFNFSLDGEGRHTRDLIICIQAIKKYIFLDMFPFVGTVGRLVSTSASS